MSRSDVGTFTATRESHPVWTLKQVQGDGAGVTLRVMDKWPAVYILASKFRGTIYIGVTSDLPGRIWEHRAGIKSKFPAKYAVHHLVYVETLGDMDTAIAREKQLKRWHRQWKINLIEADNPHWTDLAIGLGFEPLPDKPVPRPKASP